LEVTAVSQAQAGSASRTRRLKLNSDGQRHPAINGAAGYTFVAGLISVVLGLMNVAHFVGTLLGVTAFLIGIVAQMLSVTREQRMVIVVGVVGAFVGLGLGIAHGGFGL
jgi:hypothetical protein